MQYSFDATKMLRGILLAILTFFLILLVKSGDIHLLVSPMIAKIVYYSIIPFIVLTISTLRYSFTKSATHEHDHHHHQHHREHHRHEHHNHYHSHHHHLHEHSANCECGHDHAKPNSLWAQTTVGLLVVSLALAFAWHPKAFGTDMIAQVKTQNSSVQSNTIRNVSTPATTSTNAASSSHAAYAPGIINVNEDAVGIVKQTNGDSEASIAMRYGENPKAYIGKKVELDGFVYHPDGLPANHFVLTRFFIFCCVADASPIGITVNSPEAGKLKNDTWVHISGVIQAETLPILDQIQPTNWFPNDSKKPVIVANSIQVIPTPAKPYMIPN